MPCVKWDENASLLCVFCFYKMNYGFSFTSAHRISCISRDRILDNLQFQATTKKIVFPHKFVKFILILSSSFLSLPLHLFESKCHWKRSAFGLIWNVKFSSLLLLPRKSSLKTIYIYFKFLVQSKKGPLC